MLSIVTGLPGACKTLYTLSVLLPGYRGRAVYVYGIPGLDFEHFNVLELEEPEKWYDLPEGSVIIMDEAQSIFPLRKVGSVVPPKCSHFETHRHRGHDIVLITQDATTLDVHIRKMANAHIHCKRLFGTHSSTIFIYGKYQPKPEDRNCVRSAISSKTWRFDKKIFNRYRSADMHTVKRKIPTRLLLVPVIVFSAIGATWWAISAIASMFDNDKKFIEQLSESSPFQSGEVSQGEVVHRSGPGDWLAARTPVVEGMPWTAPIYNDVQQVVTFPKPHCVIVHRVELTWEKNECLCYTQQVTRLENVSDAICWQIATRGWFDATKALDRGRGRAQRDAPAPESLGSAGQSGHFSQGNGRGRLSRGLRGDSTRSKLRDRKDLERFVERAPLRDGA